MIHRFARLAFGRLGKGRRLLRFLPAPAPIGRAIDRGAEVTRLRSHEHGEAVARVEHQVVDHTAEEVRPVEPPLPARRIRAVQECALASPDQQQHL
jgi:hypothetical protein